MMNKEQMEIDYVKKRSQYKELVRLEEIAEDKKRETVFSRLFGTDINERIKKLAEEFCELQEAEPQTEQFMDELCDVNAVLFHLNNLLGVTHNECVEKALMKVKIRQVYPEYKHDK